MNRVWILAPVLTLGLVACGKKHEGNYEVAEAAADAQNSNVELMVTGADALWEKRGEEESLRQALAAYEGVVSADPTNRHAYARLTRGYYFLGDGVLTEPAAKGEAWNTSVSWGKKCLALNSDFVGRVESGQTEAEAGAAFGQEDMPCMYWMASSLGKWAKAESLATILQYKDQIYAWMLHLDATDPEYFYAAADRYLGAYWAALPSFAGQDLDKSQEHFLAAIEANPDHFGNRVLYADYWAKKTQNKEVFLEQLNMVVSGDPSVIEGLEPEQRAEQVKAQALLDQADDLFVD
ncbi:MAG: TRAP transporter TatT component family protein [Myxococcota bacterium]|nr:TRAP transporter TatT component family protein [Myxococcota bacterium]